jgi:hypothetical protein
VAVDPLASVRSMGTAEGAPYVSTGLAAAAAASDGHSTHVDLRWAIESRIARSLSLFCNTAPRKQQTTLSVPSSCNPQQCKHTRYIGV